MLIRAFFLAVVSFMLLACASAQLHLQAWMDPEANINTYQTFEVEAVQDGEQYMRINEMLMSGFVLAMESKSFRPAAVSESADLKLRFMTQVKHGGKLRADEIPTVKGIYTKYNMVAVNEGSLLVNVIDAARDKVIWKGSTIRDINNLDVSKLTQSRINERVIELLASLPSRD